MGDQARLRRAVHKLMRGDSLTIAAVGSSITAGAGGTNLWPSYVDQFVLWLRRAFPNANINFKNAALGVRKQLYSTRAPCWSCPDVCVHYRPLQLTCTVSAWNA